MLRPFSIRRRGFLGKHPKQKHLAFFLSLMCDFSLASVYSVSIIVIPKNNATFQYSEFVTLIKRWTLPGGGACDETEGCRTHSTDIRG